MKVKKFLKYFVILIGCIIIILLIIPYFISLNSYKGMVIDKVRETIGRELKINGDITFALLPTPTIKLKSASLSSLPGAHAPSLLEVQELSASISLFSLLKGNINIAAIDIYEPVLNLERLSNGSASWEFSSNADSLPKDENQAAQINHPTAFPSVYIDSIKLLKGKVNYFDFSKNRHEVNTPTTVEIDNLEIKNLQGPANIACQFYSSGKHYNLNGNIYEKQGIIAMQTNINILQEKIIVAGDLDRDNMSFIGQFTAEGNSKSLQDIFPTIKILKDSDHKLTANIDLNKKLLNFKDIKLSSGKILATGHANFSPEDNKLDLRLKLNPGNIDIHLTPIEKDLDNSFNEKFAITSTSLKPLFDELAINVTGLSNLLLNQPFAFSTSALYRDQDLSLNDINLSINKANLKGNVRVKNWQKEILATYNLTANEVSALASLLAINLPVKLNDLVIKGETSGDKGRIKTNTILQFAKTTTNIRGNIGTEKTIKPNLTIESSGENLDNTINVLTSSSGNLLGRYSLLAHLEGDITKALKINIDKFTVVVKKSQSNLNGNININLKAPKLDITSDIKITSLNLNDLSSDPATNKSVNPPKESASSPPWSRDKIDLSFLKKFDGNFTLYIQKIIKGDLILDTIKASMSLSNGVLNITNLNGKLYGGEVELTGQISSQNNQAINLKTNLKGAQLRNIITPAGKIKITQGVVNFSANINSLGQNQFQYISNLGGNTILTATEGMVSGFDLQKILNSFKKTKSLEDILRIFEVSFSGGSTKFQNLILSTEIKNGVANIVEGKLVSEESEITAKGNIELPKYYCDINGIVALDIKKSLPPFKVRFYGTLNNIQHKLDTQLLEQYFIKNVLSNVIEQAGQGKKPAELIKNLIGIDQGKNPAASQDEQPSSANKNPLQELKTIGKELKGLFK